MSLARIGIIAFKWGLAAALALASISAALAQGTAPATPVVKPATAQSTLDVLKGSWARPDGGYLIVIRNVGPQGQLDAMYFNPRELPFAKAQVARVGSMMHISLELRAGGYAGSTYELAYDAASDRLTGIYYQAVAKQKFDVFFVRKKTN